MKIYAINGSPRKNKNTAELLQQVLAGVKDSVKDKEIDTELIHLYDLKYTGCKSCFACKKIGGASYGRCAIKDDLYEITGKLAEADGMIFGSPIYFGNTTGQMQSFLERLLFPYYTYDKNNPIKVPKKIPIVFIYTMNASVEMAKDREFLTTLNNMQSFIEGIFTKPVVMYSEDTYQFDDYSKYRPGVLLEKRKAEHRKIQFPLDCQKAFEIGVDLLK